MQPGEGVHHHPLHLPALRPGAGGRQAQASDAAARSHPGRQNVPRVEVARVDLKKQEAGETFLSIFFRRASEVGEVAAVVEVCYLAGVQVGGVLHGARVVAVVPLFDDGVQQV